MADFGLLSPQIELVELQTGDTDPKTNFRLIIIQTELERFKFLVRSFLRTRIAKVLLSDGLLQVIMLRLISLISDRQPCALYSR